MIRVFHSVVAVYSLVEELHNALSHYTTRDYDPAYLNELLTLGLNSLHG